MYVRSQYKKTVDFHSLLSFFIQWESLLPLRTRTAVEYNDVGHGMDLLFTMALRHVLNGLPISPLQPEEVDQAECQVAEG